MLKNFAHETTAESQRTSDSPQSEKEFQLEEPRAASRSILIDAVRGMAICLVALGHTNQGILHRGWWGASIVGRRLDWTIYAFHMPAFFFVSGIFIAASVARRGPGRYTVERARMLIWPYVLWSLISQGSVRVLSHFVAQQPMTLHTFLIDLLVGAGIWFLPALFLCQIVGMLLRKLPGVLIVVIAVLAYYFVPRPDVNFVVMALQFFPFVAVGMWVGRGYEQMERIPRGLAFVCALILFVLLYVAMYKPWTSYANIVLLGGVIGTLMLMMLGRSFGGSKLARVFAWAGEASLAIYLAGEYGQGLVRQLLQWMHITEPYTQLIVPTIAAILIPAWVYQYRVRLHLEWLFIAPFWKPRPRKPQIESAA